MRYLFSLVSLLMVLICFFNRAKGQSDTAGLKNRLSLESGYEIGFYPGEVFSNGFNYKIKNHSFGLRLNYWKRPKVWAPKSRQFNAYEDLTPLAGSSIKYRYFSNKKQLFNFSKKDDKFYRIFFLAELEYYKQKNGLNNDSLTKPVFNSSIGNHYGFSIRIKNYNIKANTFHSLIGTIGYGLEFSLFKNVSVMLNHNLYGAKLNVINTKWSKQTKNDTIEDSLKSGGYASYIEISLLLEL